MVGALVFSTQVCGVIATAEDGKPLRPCLTWLDKRAASLAKYLSMASVLLLPPELVVAAEEVLLLLLPPPPLLLLAQHSKTAL